MATNRVVEIVKKTDDGIRTQLQNISNQSKKRATQLDKAAKNIKSDLKSATIQEKKKISKAVRKLS